MAFLLSEKVKKISVDYLNGPVMPCSAQLGQHNEIRKKISCLKTDLSLPHLMLLSQI